MPKKFLSVLLGFFLLTSANVTALAEETVVDNFDDLYDNAEEYGEGTEEESEGESEKVSVTGTLYETMQDKTKKPLADTEVLLALTDGSTLTAVSDKNGAFTFEDVAEEEVSSIQVADTEDYVGIEEEYATFKEGLTISVTERASAKLGTNYSYGDNIKNGYVAKAGTYTIKGENGSKLSLSKEGPFSDSVTVSIKEDGTIDTVYVMKDDVLMKKVDGILMIDRSKPVVTGIDAISETSGDAINIYAHGLYTKSDADLTLSIKATDSESGVDHFYVRGEDASGKIVKHEITGLKRSGTTYTGNVKISSAVPLETILSVVAVDGVGNESEYKLIRTGEEASTLIIESVNPTLSDITVSGTKSKNDWYSDAVDIRFTAQDKDAGLHTVTLSINGNNVITNTYDTKNKSANEIKFQLTKELIEKYENADGTYAIVATATDNAGNMVSKNLTIKADIVAPILTLSGATNGGFYQNSPSISGSLNEKYYNQKGALINVKVTRNKESVLTRDYAGQASFSLPDFNADGDYTITAYAVDAAGNKSKVKELSFTKDSTKPEVSDFTFSGNKSGNNWYSGAVGIGFTARDITAGLATVKMSINGNTVIDRSFSGRNKETNSFSYTLTKELLKKFENDQGTYTMTATITDKAGNVRTIKETIHADITAPGIKLTGAEKGKHYKTAPTLSALVSEKFYSAKGSHIHVTVKRDGKVVVDKDYSSVKEVSFNEFKTDGDYTVTVYAVDAAGNKSNTDTISFVKDATAPVITISGVKNGEIYNTNRTVTISVLERYFNTNTVSITLKRNLNGKEETITIPWRNTGKTSIANKLLTKTGEYTLTVTAKDAAGNTAESKTIHFTVDAQAPTITIKNVANEEAYGKDDKINPVIEFKDEYHNSWTCELTKNDGGSTKNLRKEYQDTDDGCVVTYADFINKEDYDGIYTLDATATDKAGNKTEKSVTFSVNRYGSTFLYSKSINSLNKTIYVQEVPQDLSIKEYNVSKVKDTEEDIKLDGTPSKIQGEIKKTTERSWKCYDHTYNKKDFAKEGFYTMNLVSTDELKNVAESKKKTGAIRFAVDKTAPEAMTDKELQNASFNTDHVDVHVNVKDTISPVAVAVEVNGEKVENEKFDAIEGDVTFTVPEGRNNSVKIMTADLAGNSQVYEYDHVTVSTNPALRVLGNKYLVSGIVSAVVALAGCLVALALKRRKRRNADTSES